MSPLSRKEHDSTWDPLIKGQLFVPVVCLSWWVILHSQAQVECQKRVGLLLSGRTCPKPGGGPEAVCPLSPPPQEGLRPPMLPPRPNG